MATVSLTIDAAEVMAIVREAAALIDRLPESAVAGAWANSGIPRDASGRIDLSAPGVLDCDVLPAATAGEWVLAPKVGNRSEVLVSALRAAPGGR